MTLLQISVGADVSVPLKGSAGVGWRLVRKALGIHTEFRNSNMKAYLILDFKITDPENFMVYVREIPAHIERHNGKYIVEGVKPDSIEGNWQPDRLVVLEFPTPEDARNFLEDPEIQPVFAIRHRSTESKLILVEGGSWHDAIR